VMVAELFVTEDREFQTAGAMILNASDWKLILQSLSPADTVPVVVYWRISEYEVVDAKQFTSDWRTQV